MASPRRPLVLLMLALAAAGCTSTPLPGPDEDLAFVQALVASFNYRNSTNLADPPSVRSFMLIHRDDAGPCGTGLDPDCVPPLYAFDPYAAFNDSRFDPYWTVAVEPPGTVVGTGDDTEVFFRFEDPATYRAYVTVRDMTTDRIVLDATAAVATRWDRSADAYVNVGAGGRLSILDIPWSGEHLQALFDLHVEADPSSAPLVDRGRFLLVDQRGDEHELASTWPDVVQELAWPGPYRVDWEPGIPVDAPQRIQVRAVIWRAAALDSLTL